MLRCLHSLSHRPVNSIKGIAGDTQLSYPAVSSAIEKPEDMGIVREITGKERNRVYGYERFLSELNRESV